jgi:two-component system, LytTR family, sensor kinase
MTASRIAGRSRIHDSVPQSLRVSTVAVLLLVLVVMTGDLVVWAHGGSSGSSLGIVLATEMLVVGGWCAYEFRSTRYSLPSLDRPTRWFLHHLRRLPLLIVGFVVCTYTLRSVAFAATDSNYFPFWPFMPLLVLVEAVKIALLYFCWLGLVFGFLSFSEMREKAENLLNAQRTLAESKLTLLKGQLRPHFLFNALNTVSATMQVDVARADRLLTLVGDLLRASLDASDRNLVALTEELRLLRQYADIMQARFSERVTMTWDIAKEALGASVPSMLLQPLLENAFKHGVERNAAPQTIAIDVYRTDDQLNIVIRNSGSMLTPGYAEGFGTRSCRERLQLLYGPAASLTLRNQETDGVEVKVVLPWRSAPP